MLLTAQLTGFLWEWSPAPFQILQATLVSLYSFIECSLRPAPVNVPIPKPKTVGDYTDLLISRPTLPMSVIRRRKRKLKDRLPLPHKVCFVSESTDHGPFATALNGLEVGLSFHHHDINQRLWQWDIWCQDLTVQFVVAHDGAGICFIVQEKDSSSTNIGITMEEGAIILDEFYPEECCAGIHKLWKELANHQTAFREQTRQRRKEFYFGLESGIRELNGALIPSELVVEIYKFTPFPALSMAEFNLKFLCKMKNLCINRVEALSNFFDLLEFLKDEFPFSHFGEATGTSIFSGDFTSLSEERETYFDFSTEELRKVLDNMTSIAAGSG